MPKETAPNSNMNVIKHKARGTKWYENDKYRSLGCICVQSQATVVSIIFYGF